MPKKHLICLICTQRKLLVEVNSDHNIKHYSSTNLILNHDNSFSFMSSLQTVVNSLIGLIFTGIKNRKIVLL